MTRWLASHPPAEADGGTETKRSSRRAGDAIPGGARCYYTIINSDITITERRTK